MTENIVKVVTCTRCQKQYPPEFDSNNQGVDCAAWIYVQGNQGGFDAEFASGPSLQIIPTNGAYIHAGYGSKFDDNRYRFLINKQIGKTANIDTVLAQYPWAKLGGVVCDACLVKMIELRDIEFASSSNGGYISYPKYCDSCSAWFPQKLSSVSIGKNWHAKWVGVNKWKPTQSIHYVFTDFANCLNESQRKEAEYFSPEFQEYVWAYGIAEPIWLREYGRICDDCLTTFIREGKLMLENDIPTITNLDDIDRQIQNVERCFDSMMYDRKETIKREIEKETGLKSKEKFRFKDNNISAEKLETEKTKSLNSIRELEELERYHKLKQIVLKVITKELSDDKACEQARNMVLERSIYKRIRYYEHDSPELREWTFDEAKFREEYLELLRKQ